MENSNQTKKEEEKIVPLNEDLQGHKQDDVSYQKAMAAQEKELERLKGLKQS